MTRGFIRDVYRRRGFAAALETAIASCQDDILEEVRHLRREELNIPSGAVQVFKKEGRKQVLVGIIDERKVPSMGQRIPAKKSNKRFTGRELKPAEIAARCAALEAARAEGRV